MLRGALVLWVGVFSVIVLGRRLSRAQWAALATVMAGVAVVGVSSVGGAKKELQTFISEAGEEVDPMVGVILILVAQLLWVYHYAEDRIGLMKMSAVLRRSSWWRSESWNGTRWSLSYVLTLLALWS
jgi:drug/metabolite transporter (DMT)-like permease